MKCNSKLIKFIMLFIFVSCVPVQIVQSATSVGTLYSYYATDAWYDGYLEPTHWSSSRGINITLYNINNQGDTMEISLQSIYNTVNGSLSFAVTIPDITYNSDIFALVFKTNTSADLVYNDGAWIFGGGHDMKVIYCVDNSTADGITFDDQLDGSDDVSAGGSDDIYATGTWDGTKYVYEMHTFLSLNDPNGGDYQLTEYSQIDFLAMYIEDSMTAYTQIREDEGEFQYCVLSIGEPILLGPTTLFVVGSIIASFVLITYIYRRKK